MKTKINLNETLYQAGCPDCYPGITSATPIASWGDDSYQVLLRRGGECRLDILTSEELSAFKTFDQAQKENEKNGELTSLMNGNEGSKWIYTLMDDYLPDHDWRLEDLRSDMPGELWKACPVLNIVQGMFEDIDPEDEPS